MRMWVDPFYFNFISPLHIHKQNLKKKLHVNIIIIILLLCFIFLLNHWQINVKLAFISS